MFALHRFFRPSRTLVFPSTAWPESRAPISRCMATKFPHLPSAHRELMSDLLADIEFHLAPVLLPSNVPPDVCSYSNDAGTALGSLDIRSGAPKSSVDFILESWIHCELPSGRSLDITTLQAFLKASTNAPHFLMEFIQSSPTSLFFLLDLVPRKDLVLHVDYLTKFYEETGVDNHRHELEKSNFVQPYRSPSLYVRGILSPAAVSVSIDCEAAGERAMEEEVFRVLLRRAAAGFLNVWLKNCVGGGGEQELGDSERADLIRRDGMIKSKAIEIDLVANLPRLFGPDVADRVVRAIRDAFVENKIN